MYYVVRGRARMRVGTEDQAISAGSVIFVAANVEHHFHDITRGISRLGFLRSRRELVSSFDPEEEITHGLPYRNNEGRGLAEGSRNLPSGDHNRKCYVETQVPSWEKWNEGHLRDCRLVTRNGQQVLGWAALTAVSTRPVYAGVTEVSVYVAAAARCRGVGKALLQALVKKSEDCGIWMLQAGVFPENLASIALHKSCGFREVGVRRGLGKLGDIWRDVLLLERRSRTME